MSGGDQEPEIEPVTDLTEVADVTDAPTAEDDTDPVVIDLRDGVDTVAAYEADQAERARRG